MRLVPSSRLLSLVFLMLFVVGFCAASNSLRAQAFDIRERYTKTETQISMRDGVRLFTAIYAPKDASVKHPIMLTRTPYSIAPYGADKYTNPRGTDLKFMEAGYIVVRQDVRGRFLSEGKFVDVRPEDAASKGKDAIDESTDTYDTIDWLVKNIPNNNERVGMWGISYPGFYAYTGAINSHPALKAVSPQAPVSDWFVGDDDHHNGALFLLDCFGFLTFFGPDRPAPTTESKPFLTFSPNSAFYSDAYKFYLDLGPLKNINANYFHYKIEYWNDVTQHPNYDAFWQERSLPSHLKNVHCAVLTVGGWYDAEDLYGPFADSRAMERQNPQAPNSLVIGPWPHGGWGSGDFDHFGNEAFGQKTGAYYRDNILLPFFNHYLLDGAQGVQPRATVFATGVNQWLTFAQWPPKDTKPLVLDIAGEHRITSKLLASSSDSAQSGKAPDGANFDAWVSDPANPVPYIKETRGGRKNEYLNDDQRFAAARPDVMYYQTPPLDHDVTIAGPIQSDLWVSTTGTDADFITKVIDVYPDDAPPVLSPVTSQPLPMAGYQQLVRAEVMRVRYRDSYSEPSALTPGKPTRVKYELRDVCHTFKKGHRIMVQVQSSWFPLVDRNPQTFVDIYHADEKDFQKATHRLYHAAPYMSRVILPQLNALPASLPVSDAYLTPIKQP